jgi:hypothetical protein
MIIIIIIYPFSFAKLIIDFIYPINFNKKIEII